MGLFGKELTPQEKVRKWQKELKAEERQLDRNLRDIKREEEKAKRSMRDLAKKGQGSSAKLLAKEIVRSRKGQERIYAAKANIHAVSNTLSTNMATMKVAGHIGHSAQMMQAMSGLMKVPQVSAVAAAMSKEMMKAGIIDEMVDDAFEAMDDDELEDEADEAVDKVMAEILHDKFKNTGEATKQHGGKVAEEDDVEIDEMKARLAALAGN